MVVVTASLLPHACVAGTSITPVERQVPMPVCLGWAAWGPSKRDRGLRSATMSEATTVEGVLKRDRAIVLAALAGLLAWAYMIAPARWMPRMQPWGRLRPSSPGSCGP